MNNNLKKFQIYYKPCNNKNINSFTLSFSRINETDDTYKLKVIKEVQHNSIQTKTFKIKEFHFNAAELLHKLEQIDFDIEYDKCIDNQDMYYIKYEDKKLETSNKAQIEYILKMFKFEELFNINENQYEYIKDVYEFIKLNKLFMEKVRQSNFNNDIASILEYYITNPYKVFENLNNLDNLKFA